MKEDNKHPIDILDINDPIEAIKFYMAEHSLKQRDLAPMIGSRSKVSLWVWTAVVEERDGSR